MPEQRQRSAVALNPLVCFAVVHLIYPFFYIRNFLRPYISMLHKKVKECLCSTYTTRLLEGFCDVPELRTALLAEGLQALEPLL